MDNWLKRHALDNEGKASRTYVVAERDVVVAYYTLAVGCLNLKSLPRRLRHNLPEQVPVMVLGRLAVDTEHSGQGIGGGLLREALQRTVQVAGQVGIRALVVHAIDDAAVRFYTRIGFSALPGEPRSLILPIETIIRAFAAPEPCVQHEEGETAS
jgi:GNAT superfamily N-acetyltransferase